MIHNVYTYTQTTTMAGCKSLSQFPEVMKRDISKNNRGRHFGRLPSYNFYTGEVKKEEIRTEETTLDLEYSNSVGKKTRVGQKRPDRKDERERFNPRLTWKNV